MTDPITGFTTAYKEAMRFTDCNEDSEIPADAVFSPEMESRIQHDCDKFLEGFLQIHKTCNPATLSAAGHDFWLTRNSHGAGFWDGDWPEDVEKELTDLAKSFRECELYLGDDGLVYPYSLKTYKVTWTIEVDANSPLAAAQVAREIQLDKDSTATVFEVEGVVIDLVGDTNNEL